MWLDKLFTSHDVFNVHKSLGIVCIVNFVYKYMYIWPMYGALHAHISDILLHLSLSLSGLMFRVPLKRLKKMPTTIWKEYQIHAVVFSCRSLPVFFLHGLYRVAGIALVHLAADVVTSKYGDTEATTVRGKHERQCSLRTTVIMRSYACYQWLALASHLVGENKHDLAWNTFIAIQSSAFCMTLHRKGLIRWQTHAIVYSMCIFVSAVFIVQSLPIEHCFLAACAGMARLHNINKYVTWAIFLACTKVFLFYF